jgi:hypothetical protein
MFKIWRCAVSNLFSLVTDFTLDIFPTMSSHSLGPSGAQGHTTQRTLELYSFQGAPRYLFLLLLFLLSFLMCFLLLVLD